MDMLGISEETLLLGKKAQDNITPYLTVVDDIAMQNSIKVLEAFQKHRVSEVMMIGTTGYGYDDMGRDTLDKIYARVFGCEAALVRIGFVNGTHALSCAIRACLNPKDTMLSITGAPYDTLMGTIKGGFASLEHMGISYEQIDIKNGEVDMLKVKSTALENHSIKLVFIQRSRGYSDRKALSCRQIHDIIKEIKVLRPDINVMVDNCYGEFCEVLEPTQVGADIMAGSLIKNPGGSIAPMGGYIAGKKELVDNAARWLTSPSIGSECGATLSVNRLLYQGFFMAPHIVSQAIKTAIFCSEIMGFCGYDVSPKSKEVRCDIIQTVKFGNKDDVERFCKGIQRGSPINSFVTPEGWDMPGYGEKVIMAAGAFVQGSSIELSADSPLRPPYICYIQGGITFESGKLGILLALEEMKKSK